MENNKILVGYGRVDISPDKPVPMGGYGNPAVRISEEVRDPLYATCLAFTDADNNTALIFSTDAINALMRITTPIRQELGEKYGLPISNVLIAATHSHSTPDMLSVDDPVIQEQHERYRKGILQAAEEAMADRKPAEIWAGYAMTERMNFVRHYRMADGTFAGSNFGDWSSGIVGHTSDPDAKLQMVKFVREGGEDVLLMNWQAHPCFTGGINAKVVSADYIGEVRKYMEEKTGAKFVFFQGAAGNHNARSVRKSEIRTNDPVEYGKLLGDYALYALDHMRPLAGGPVSAREREIRLELDHSDDHLVPQAREIWQDWREHYDREDSNRKARAIGKNSIYAIGSVLSRAGAKDSELMDVHAVRVGDIGFAGAPYEMFGTNGQYIKERSPYPVTVVVSCCNDARSYLASDFAFSHGSYEVDIRRYPRGTAEHVAEQFVEMLKEMK